VFRLTPNTPAAGYRSVAVDAEHARGRLVGVFRSALNVLAAGGRSDVVDPLKLPRPVTEVVATGGRSFLEVEVVGCDEDFVRDG
jgi:hypothetical protein